MPNTQPHVVVLGGGFGGLETAYYLRMRLPEQAKITIVSDRDYFMFKPNTIYVPFGLDPEKLEVPVRKPAHRRDINFVQGTARGIDPAARTVELANGRIGYDYLVVATGAGMRATEIPGLAEHAETIWSPADMLHLRAAYYTLVEQAKLGKHQRVLFLVPPANKCSGPLYEMVMMLDTWLRRQRVRRAVDITWSTYESGYIQAFGPRLNESVADEFVRRGVTGHREYTVKQVERNGVQYENGQFLPYDLLISFPPYIAATPFAGLPADERGFIATDLGSRRVQGHPEIFAVGDAGDFPVKQAFLAFLQADAAAEALAAEITGTQPAFAFEPVSMCVMEEFDTATFAQVPLHLTGDAARPVEVDPAANGRYLVGSSPVWRLGKKLLGYYLPYRFGAGNPFHAGLPWKGMDAGLKVMSKVLAS